ncbi:MAG: autotransporter domain-containing protein [Caulobacteraceae bacterium]
MIRALVATTALVGSLALASGAAQAATSSPFGGVTVFGDSLSDDGNISIASGSPTLMRFTTNPGLTTIENVAAFYGLPLSPSLAGGTDFAFGGAGVNTNAPGTPAGVPTETQQITAYLSANPKVNPNELFSVFGGANDIFYNATSAEASGIAATLIAAIPASTPAAARAVQVQQINALVEQVAGVNTLESQTDAFNNVTAAAAQELTLIGNLQKAGARYIVVFNLPDIGKTPEATADNAVAPGSSTALTTLSQGFNNVLNSGLSQTKVGIIPVNTFALLNEVLASPAQYGFVNTTIPACTTSSSINCTPQTLVNPTAASNFVFADGVHPTTAAHALFAQYIEAEVAAPQQISLLAEAPLAVLDSERNAVANELLYDQVSGQTGVRLFATGGYAHEHIKGESFTPDSRDNDGLITAGVDWRPNDEISFGGELTGSESTDRLNGELTRFRLTSVTGSIFGQYIWRQHTYVDGAVGFGSLDFHDIQRVFKLGTATRVENGDVGGSTTRVNIDAGYWLGGPALHTGPFVGGIYEHVRVDNYNEDGDDSTAMSFGAQTRESLVGEAGWRVQGALPMSWGMLSPYAEIAYAYDGDARQRDVVGGLNSMNGTFAVPGFTPDREWGEVQVGLNGRIGPHWSAYIAYEGRFAGRTTDYDSGDIGLKYAF